MPNRTVTIPPTGNPVWDDLIAWWLPRYKPSTQQAYSIRLRCWTDWCAERNIELMAATRPNVEAYLRDVAAKGYSRDIAGDQLERHASHQVAGFFAGLSN